MLLARLFRPPIAKRLRPVAGLGLLNSDLAISLGYVLRAATEFGCAFDVPLRVHGREAIPAGPALFASGHLYLAIAAVRFLCEQGRDVVLVRPTPEEHRLIGTRTPMPIIPSTRHLFVQMRNALRGGTSVAAMLDDASTGELVIRRPAIEIAVRSGIPIVFFKGDVAPDGAIDVTFERPRASDVEGIARELLEFL